MKQEAHMTIIKQELIKKYLNVFGEGVRQITGEHHIRVNSTVDPVKHAPRRVPVALRAQVKDALDDLEKQEVITTVIKPTACISSMVVAPQKSGKLRICLVPRYLNMYKAIQREHYTLPTIEDIATRLHVAKVFTK